MAKNPIAFLAATCVISLCTSPCWAQSSPENGGETANHSSPAPQSAVPSTSATASSANVAVPPVNATAQKESGANVTDKEAVQNLADSTLNGAPVNGTATTSTIPNSTTANSTQANGSAVKASLPTKIVSVAVAMCVGTPVCVVRRSKWEDKYAVSQMTGDSNNKFAKKLAAVFWLPFSIVNGTCEAAFDATANGLMYCNRPFSKDQLSLGKLIQNN